MSQQDLKLLDNLLKQTSTFSHRAIQQGSCLKVKVPGTEQGYLEGTVYWNRFPDAPIEWSGLGIHTSDQDKDGLITIPLYNPFGKKTPLPKANGYLLKVEGARSAQDMAPA